MKCPRTGSDLKAFELGGVTVDISEVCGGVFFDKDEVGKFDHKTKIRGGLLVNHLKQFTPPKLDLNLQVSCPKCKGVEMQRQYYNHKNSIEIDTCPRCEGTWFDFGELEKLREIASESLKKISASQEFEKELLSSVVYQEYKVALDNNASESERSDKAEQLRLFIFNCIC